MPHKYTVDEDLGRIEVRFAGEVSLQERLRASREVYSTATRLGIRRILLDFRQAHSLGGAYASSAELAGSIARNPIAHSTRLAYLVRHEHQIDGTVEALLTAQGVPCRRFVDQAPAFAWLAHAIEPDPASVEATRVASPVQGESHLQRLGLLCLLERVFADGGRIDRVTSGALWRAGLVTDMQPPVLTVLGLKRLAELQQWRALEM